MLVWLFDYFVILFIFTNFIVILVYYVCCFKNMSDAIAEEEEAIVRKENLDVLARREKMIRGNKALKKERAKKEAANNFKEMKESNRKEKIQIATEGTYHVSIF